jgi:hypothetical protein
VLRAKVVAVFLLTPVLLSAAGTASVHAERGPGGDVAIEPDGTGLVEDDEDRSPCVQVDAAVICGGRRGKSHQGLLQAKGEGRVGVSYH